MTPPQSQPERDMIIALFRRIGQQLELKEEWKKLPNAERNAMAGDFYNIIKEPRAAGEAVLDDEHKPGCFGACGLPSCNISGCNWIARCKQSRIDY